MSFAFPADFGPTIAGFLNGCGDIVVFRQRDADPGDTITLKGSLQRPSTTGLVGDAEQETWIFYAPGAAFGSVEPVKYDRLAIHGIERSIDRASRIEAAGQVLAWEIVAIG